MKAKPFNTCLVCLCFLLYSSALPRAKDYRTMGSEYVPNEPNLSTDTVTEPTCEELRAMWRFSKRQSRAAEITNEIPTYRDPFMYNVWEEYARPRSAGRGTRYRKPIYGRVIHSATPFRAPENSLDRNRAFEEVARLFVTSMHPVSGGVPRRKSSLRLVGGGGAAQYGHMPLHSGQSGSFQHLKELIRTERARELQEQRMSEEAERNMMVKFGRVNDNPPPVENSRPKEKPIPNRGVVAFPDILGPPAQNYMDDYLYSASLNNKYKSSRLPESNTIINGGNQWAW